MTHEEVIARIQSGRFANEYGFDLQILVNAVGALGEMLMNGWMIYCVFDALRGVVRGWRWTYKYKHRFDKPPTAACYCKDCIYHGTTYKDGGNNKCNFPGIDIWTPDEGFCFEAEPINAQEAKKRAKDD